MSGVVERAVALRPVRYYAVATPCLPAVPDPVDYADQQGRPGSEAYPVGQVQPEISGRSSPCSRV
jgi:hypothetical protein